MFFSKLVDDESETTASESRLRDSLSNQETSSKIENDAQVKTDITVTLFMLA